MTESETQRRFAAGFEDEGRGYKLKNAGSLQRLKKGEELDCPLEPPEEASSADPV